MKAIISILVAVVALPAAAQDVPTGLFSMDPTAEPQQRYRSSSGSGKSQRNFLGFKVEHWEPELEVTEVDPEPPLREDEHEFETLHVAGMATFDYQNNLSRSGRLDIHVGLGIERLVVTKIDTDPGDSEGFVRLDDGFAFELGAGYTALFDNSDVKIYGLARFGGSLC